MVTTLEEYLFNLIACRPLGLQGAHDGPRAALGWAAGVGAVGHMVAPELSRVGQRELEPQDTWRPRSCPGLGSGSWSRRTRDGLGAALGYAVHTEVMNTWERVIYMPYLLS
jgi:hypothetical protein